MAFQIAQAAVEIETARLLTYNAARLKEEGANFTKEAAMAKYWSSVVAQKVAGSAIEWAGGVGFTREAGIEKYWRDSKIVSIQFISLVLGLTGCSGCYLRRNLKYSTPNYRQIYPKGILIMTSRHVYPSMKRCQSQ